MIPPPVLRATVFPDHEIAAAVTELRTAADWLARADSSRARLVAAELGDWTGGFRRRFDDDTLADRRACDALIRDLRATADDLERAAADAARLRRQRQRTHEVARAAWLETLATR